MIKFDDYLTEKLQDDRLAQEYINVALEEFFKDHNKELFLMSLNKVVRANGGVAKIAKETHINKQHLYKILSTKGNPTLGSIGSLLTALRLQLRVEALRIN